MASQAALVKRSLNDAIRNSQTFTIRCDGESGKVTIIVRHKLVAKYNDVYECIEDLMPELMGELT